MGKHKPQPKPSLGQPAPPPRSAPLTSGDPLREMESAPPVPHSEAMDPEIEFEDLVSLASWIREELRDRTLVILSLLAALGTPLTVASSGLFHDAFLSKPVLGIFAAALYGLGLIMLLLSYHLQEGLGDSLVFAPRYVTEYLKKVLSMASDGKADNNNLRSLMTNLSARLVASDRAHSLAVWSILASLASLLLLAVLTGTYVAEPSK